jgi:flagellar basal body-associated protein FliL
MSTEAKPEEKKTAEAPPAKKSGGPGILGILLPALIAGGAAFGGARVAAGHAPAAAHAEPAEKHHVVKAPGPTQALEPFLVTVHDANHKGHPMKMTVAIEFDAQSHDDPKNLVPRLRDTILTYLRSVTYEQLVDGEHNEKMRTEMLERCRAAGAGSAEKILITDFVVQ